MEYYLKTGACYEDVEQWEKIFLLYTYKCNAACEHCLTESNPHKAEKLTLDVAKRIVDTGRHYSKCWLMVSGGEPLLYFKEIEELCAYAATRGYYCCVGTNGFWAKDASMARECLARLAGAGVRAVFPSATAYHAPFVPTRRITFIAEAAKALGVICEINFYPSPDAGVDRRIGLELGLDKKDWYTDGLILTGNPVDHLRGVFPACIPAELDDCGSVHLAFTPAGEAICNCNVTYRCDEFKDSPFHLGNIFEDDLTTIFERERSNEILQFMMKRPCNVIHSALSTDAAVCALYAEREARKRYYSATEYYLDVLANTDYRAALRRAALR